MKALKAMHCSAIFIDCEASSFTGFVTEVGWAEVWSTKPPIEIGGSVVPCARAFIRSCSRLIRVDEWLDDFGQWDYRAEAITGITRANIMQFGRPASEVAAWLNEELGGLTTFSDNPRYDARWVDQVFEAASSDSIYADQQRDFAIRDISRAFEGNQLDEVKFDAGRRAMMTSPAPHRAAADAARWAWLRQWSCGGALCRLERANSDHQVWNTKPGNHVGRRVRSDEARARNSYETLEELARGRGERQA